MSWTDEIRRVRDKIEIKYGRTPTYLIVREEIYWQLIEEHAGECMELDDMIVAQAVALQNPFELIIPVDGEEDN